jgi:PAS domain-containing protein
VDVIKTLAGRVEDGVKAVVHSGYRNEIREQIETSRKNCEELESRVSQHFESFVNFKDRSTMLEYILDHTSVIVCMMDLKMVYRFANERCCKFFKKEMNDIIDHTVKEVVGDKIWETIKEKHERVIAGETIVHEFVGDVNGNNVDFVVQYYPYFNGGPDQVGYIMIASELTFWCPFKVKFEGKTGDRV